jgi:RNA polymerase sigma factor (sigma-70 family)
MTDEQRLQIVINATKRIYDNETFDTDMDSIMDQMPDYQQYLNDKNDMLNESKNVSVELMPCWREPVLSREQEQHVARQFNFLKFMALKLAKKNQIEKAEQFLAQAQKSREVLALANMRLVIGVIRKIHSEYKEDLVSEAYVNIFKATDYFDWRRGLRFNTYATLIITKNLWRTNFVMQKQELLHQNDFNTNVGRDLGFMEESQHQYHVNLTQQLLVSLEDEREREIIKRRFGIGCNESTLEECGDVFSVTRERIRQIQNTAMNRLKQLVVQQSIVLDEVA